QVGLLQRLGDGLAQGWLRQALGAGVDRGERLGQRRVGAAHARMDHLAAEQAAAHFAARAQAPSDDQLLLLAGVEIQPAQLQLAGAVAHDRGQLAARPVQDFTAQDLALDLGRQAGPQRGDRHDTGFVFVAQRQVQDAVAGRRQPQAVQLALHIRQRAAGVWRDALPLACRGGGRHGATDPYTRYRSPTGPVSPRPRTGRPWAGWPRPRWSAPGTAAG